MDATIEHQSKWSERMWELMFSLNLDDSIADLKLKWDAFNQSPDIRISIFGVYDAGKSALLKRLLVENSQTVPAWLTISGQQETFVQNEIRWDDFIIKDTPGLLGGNQDHQLEALAALQLADAYIWVMPPQLVTGDRELIGELIKGTFFADELNSSFVTSAIIAVISQMDTAGSDPEYDREGFDERCDFKVTELEKIVRELGAKSELRASQCVAADPYGLVGNTPEPTKEHYHPKSGDWDGIAKFQSLVEDLPSDKALLRSKAKVRYTALAAQVILSVIDAEKEQREKAVDICRSEVTRYEFWQDEFSTIKQNSINALQVQLDHEWVVINARFDQPNQETAIEFNQGINSCVAKWSKDFDDKLSEFTKKIECEVEGREQSASFANLAQLISGIEAINEQDRTRIPRQLIGGMTKVAPAIRKGLSNQSSEKMSNQLMISKGFEKTANSLAIAASAFEQIAPLVSEILDEQQRREALKNKQEVMQLLRQTNLKVAEDCQKVIETTYCDVGNWLESQKASFQNQADVLVDQVNSLQTDRSLIEEHLGTVSELAV